MGLIKHSYCIRKFVTIEGTQTRKEFVQETFMVNNHSEVQEYDSENIVDTVVEMMNSNADRNCRYKKVKI
tara:strand:+ start:106 stop:315 length:210 start_codon:yes stop_codon:yes gene_type:complete